MANKSFTSINQLQKEIVHRAKKALNNEVKDYVVDKLKSNVQKKVYNTYSPVEYERREANGGLLDDSNLDGERGTTSIRAKVHDRTLTVYEEAPVDPPKLNHKEYNAPDGLARLIEEGAMNPWNNRHYKWENPRPFVTKTQEDIDKHPSEIVKMVKNRIEHDDGKK